MTIASKNLRLQIEQLLEAGLRIEPGIVHVGVFHIADMLRNERLDTACERERVLLLGACRENARSLGTAGLIDQRRRSKTAGTAHELQSLKGLAMLVNAANAKHAHDRIVVAGADGTVVPQERIGNARQLRIRFAVVGDDGLVMDVARGHD